MVKIMSEKISVNISKDLYALIKKQVKNSGGAFNSAEEYVEFVLSEVLKEEETERALTPDEEEQIEKRLRNLGYI
jgi:Arc/MetJ-type ribon-helix-helix transcriptional regulator